MAQDRAEYMRRYQAEHQEQIRANRKKYRENHRDEIREYDRVWRKTHPEQVKSYRNKDGNNTDG